MLPYRWQPSGGSSGTESPGPVATHSAYSLSGLAAGGGIHTDGGIPVGTPALISGGAFVISGAVVQDVVKEGRSQPTGPTTWFWITVGVPIGL